MPKHKHTNPYTMDNLIVLLIERLDNHIDLVNQFYGELNPDGLPVIYSSAREIDIIFREITHIAFQQNKCAELEAMLPPQPMLLTFEQQKDITWEQLLSKLKGEQP